MSSGIEDRFHFLLAFSLSRGYAIVKDKIAFLKQSLSILHNAVGRISLQTFAVVYLSAGSPAGTMPNVSDSI